MLVGERGSPSSSGTCRRAARRRPIERVPADDRRDRLVDVHDVVAAGAQLACAASSTACGVSARFETAPLAGNPNVRPERDEPVGQLALLRARAPVQPRGQAVGRVERREHRDVVAGPAQARRASASMWRVTPPGYVHEYGDTRAIRISDPMSWTRLRCG